MVEAFHAVALLAQEKDVSLREAAFLLGVRRIAEALAARGVR